MNFFFFANSIFFIHRTLRTASFISGFFFVILLFFTTLFSGKSSKTTFDLISLGHNRQNGIKSIVTKDKELMKMYLCIQDQSERCKINYINGKKPLATHGSLLDGLS